MFNILSFIPKHLFILFIILWPNRLHRKKDKKTLVHQDYNITIPSRIFLSVRDNMVKRINKCLEMNILY